MSQATTQSDGAPRGETDLYGQPVTEWSPAEGVYYEAYVAENHPRHILVAKYTADSDGGWVKRGLEKMTLSELFDYAQQLRRGE